MRTHALLSLAHDLGWTLIHFCWQGALVATVLSCVLSLFSGRSPRMRYLSCCLALLMMAVLPIFTYVRIATGLRPTSGTPTLPLLRTTAVALNRGTTPPEGLLNQLTQGVNHSLPALLILWCVGVLLVLSRLGVGLVVAHRMTSTKIRPVPLALQATFNQLLQKMALAPSVRLRGSALVDVPTLIGWVRPVVLLPVICLSGLSSTQLEALLIHELAHVRRHDYLVNVLQSVVEALLFYHPAVWWVSRQIRAERETCCDDIAVGVAGDALDYARALSLLEEYRSASPQPILEATGGVLVMRIKRLVGVHERPSMSPLAALVALTFILTGLAMGVSTIAKAQPKLVAQGTTSTQSRLGAPPLSGEYQKWLDEDVRWVITPAERTVFLHLSSGPERDHFIQQFWLRRDAAGAAPDSARREHYQRIAYANQHFTASRPGWETDRGRIFILYGAPNSIDAHTADGHSDKPYEVWGYDNALNLGHHVELQFVDTCKCGDYELTSEPEARANPSEGPDKALYEKGLAQIDQGSYEVARLSLQTLLNNYPSSSFAQSAQLAIATSWDQQGDAVAMRQAELAYDDAKVTPTKVGGSVSAPVLTFQAEPEYSESARAAKEQGDVLLSLWIDDQGRPSHVRVVKGLAADLDGKAVEAVRKYRFKPAMRDGAPVLVAMSVDVNFAIF